MKTYHTWRIFLLFALLGGIFTSCVTMQDDVYIDSVSASTEISSFEKRFSQLDAQYYASDDARKDKALQKETERLVSDIEESLADVSLQKAIVARLYAIAGCLSCDMGSRGQAKKYYEASLAAFKGDPRTLILAHRLGIEENLSEKKKLFSDKSLLVLEEALTRYADMEYDRAAAAFDEAFLSLEAFYRDSYKDLRDTSWSLRNSDPASRNAALLAQKRLTVMQMLLITNQNPDLLFNYTVGKPVSDKELYTKIAGSGLLSPVSRPLDADNAVSKDTTVTRLVAARFLWNLYNQRRNTVWNVTKYSELYKNKKRSPIPDVKLDSPDFDAALGCVEEEIMHLEDGIDFGAEHEVSGIEFTESVGKLK